MTKNGKLNGELFEGSTINTPSMLCLQDYLDALDWVESVGGVKGTIARSDANAAVIAEWVARTLWVEFLARVPSAPSNTSPCLSIVDPEVAALPPEMREAFPRRIAALLDAENAAKDIASHRSSPPGLRIWTGATVEKSDLELLVPWLDLGFRRGETSSCQSGLSATA